MRNQRSLVVAAGIAALLMPAAAAQAATKQVTIGPAKPLAGVPPVAFDADFYPRKITIAKGDHIRFKWATGFGDVIFVPKGEDVPPLAVPRPDKLVADAKDAAGNPMWFNGQPNLSPNVPALMPQGGKVIDGSKVVSSGFALDGPQKPWKVRFTKAGTYRLTSVFHPSKKLTVKVKKNRKAVPGKKADKRALAKQVAASTKLAKKLAAFEGPQGNVVRAGNDAKGIAQIAFFPAKKTVKVGDTVTFEMSKDSIELHNVHFGPKDYLDAFAQSFIGEVFQPFVVYRSDAPGTAVSYDGTNHGNGYFNTGVLDADEKSPFPSKDSVTFTKAGTYAYYCAVHGNDMAGEIVVQ
jgi:plastocyanin